MPGRKIHENKNYFWEAIFRGRNYPCTDVPWSGWFLCGSERGGSPESVFVLEASLHRFQREKLFMAYYLLLPQQFLLQRVKQIWRLSCIACHGLRLTERLPLYVFRESCTVAVQSRKSANIWWIITMWTVLFSSRAICSLALPLQLVFCTSGKLWGSVWKWLQFVRVYLCWSRRYQRENWYCTIECGNQRNCCSWTGTPWWDW